MTSTTSAVDGFHHYLEEDLQDIDPRFTQAYDLLRGAARRRGALSEAERELIGLAINAAVTHLNTEAAARHLRLALDAGATRVQVLETLQMTSVLGIHAVTVGLPIILDELAIDLPDELAGAKERIKADFIERRGSWSELWNSLLQVDEEFFKAYLEFSGVPWSNATGGLSPKLRELVYVAIDAATHHLMELGIRGHARNAIKYGATLDELVEVLELTALVGMQTYTSMVAGLTQPADARPSEVADA